MATNRPRDPVVAWGLAGGILNLVGLVMLMVRLAAGLGVWALAVGGTCITLGLVCTITSRLISRSAR